MKQVERIQLRGISRTPSDRMTADGGCAESMNVQLDSQELRPMAIPNYVNVSDYGIDQTVTNIYFMHKSGYYKSYIARRVANGQSYLTAYVKNPNGGHFSVDLLELIGEEKICDIKSLGNTIITSTDRRMYYCLFKEGTYHSLGDKIPVPDIKFEMTGYLTDITEGRGPENREYQRVNPIGAVDLSDSFNWDSDLSRTSGNPVDRYRVFSTDTLAILSHINDAILKEYQVTRQTGTGPRPSQSPEVRYPMFFRYALVLYDGTRYAASVPFLLGADIKQFSRVGLSWDTSGDYRNQMIFSINVPAAYNVAMRFIEQQANIFAGWEDIVKGVEIYASPEVAPLINSDAAYIRRINSGEHYSWSDTPPLRYHDHDYEITIDPYYTVENHEELLKNIQQTYLVKKYSIDEFQELALVGRKVLDDVNLQGEHLLSQTALKEEAYQSIHTFHADKLFELNNRISIHGITQRLSHSTPYLTCPVWRKTNDANFQIGYVFSINQNGITYKIASRKALDDVGANPRYITKTTTDSSVINSTEPAYNVTDSDGCWLAYPDSRCTAIEVYVRYGNTTYRKKYVTEQFAAADVSYVFLGFNGLMIHEDVIRTGSVVGFVYSELEDIVESPDIYLFDELAQSKVANPYVFPSIGRRAFGSMITEIAAVTRALSQGQFGDYQLYTFTQKGIWALSLDAEGNLGEPRLVSQDIALPNSVTQIDQAIVFVTARGVKILSASDLNDLSDNMLGKPYKPDEMIVAMLADDEELTKILFESENVTFMDFMTGAKVSYDFTGKRLIFVSPNFTYQYVYKLDTSTWHKISINNLYGSDYSIYPVNILNAYPACHIVMRRHNNNTNTDLIEIRDFSTIIDESERTTVITYKVILTGYSTNKVTFIRAFARHFNKTLLESKYIIENTPYVLLTTNDSQEAVALMETLLELGGTAEMETETSETSESIVANATSLPGFIVTRPFDLQNPDIRKVITDIRIRGSYRRGHVRYILQGSYDGHEWMVVRSLRGGSYKLFRLIIIARLTPIERLSWIDVVYDTRFINKLR